MPIPASIRALIGTADLSPVWRLATRAQPYSSFTDITPEIITPEGPAITARLDLATAPAHTLEITTTGAGPFDYTDPDAQQYRLEAGYRTPDGDAYYETVGYYFISDGERTNTEYVTRFGSQEIQVIGMVNASPRTSDNPMIAAAEAAMAHPTAKVSTYIDTILRTVLPEPWDYGAALSADAWEPASVEDFDTAAGVDVWGSITKIATAAEKRIVPVDTGAGFRLAPALRTLGTPSATIDAAHLTDHRTIDSPRDELDAYLVKFTQIVNGEELPGIVGNSTPASIRPPLRRGEITTLDGITSRRAAAAYSGSRMAALNTLMRRQNFTAPAMPWLKPEDTITLRAGSSSTNLLISTISFDLVAGTMTITARG